MGKLTKAQISTLREMQGYSDKRHGYYFRQATAKSLVAIGLAAVVKGDTRKFPLHYITDAGRAALKDKEEGK